MSQLRRVVEYLDMYGALFRDIEPELEAMVKLYIWRHTMFKTGATIGQDMLDLKLFDTRTWDTMSGIQALGVAACSIGFPYICRRFRGITNTPHYDKMETAVQALSLVNFVAFLSKGHFRSLQERVLGVSCGHSSLASALNPVDYDFMSRELLWHGFAEFLAFILPLVNYHKLKNMVLGYIRTRQPALGAGDLRTRKPRDIRLCAICQNTPTNVTEIGCRHVFCYYCITTGFLVDKENGIKCPICLYHMREQHEIKFVTLKGF
jgi:peroxin-2